MSKLATIMEDIARRRGEHDKPGGCPYGGRASEVHMNPADIERLDLDDGEDLCGLTLRSDEKVGVRRMRIYCDRELGGSPPVERASRSTSTPIQAPPVKIPTPVAS